jgi:4-alpha-glucanotransferase
VSRSESRRNLHRLARAKWIQTGYVGTDKKRHRASDEALMGILRALGVEIDRPEDAAGILMQTKQWDERRVLEPVVVQRGDEPLRVEATLPASTDTHKTWVVLRLDHGEEHRWRLDDLQAHVVQRRQGTDDDASPVVEFSVPGSKFHPGYHTLELEKGGGKGASGDGDEASSVVVSAPSFSPQPDRCYGVFVPVYALRSAEDWGIGSYGELARLGRWADGLGSAFIGTLPLCAVLDDVPFGDTSPYMPATRLAWNDAYIDVGSVPEMSSSPESAALVESPQFCEEIDRLRRGDFCDPRGVVATKRKVLRVLARALCSVRSRRREDFEAFVEARPELVSYALFRAECERQRQPFQRWPSRVHETLRQRPLGPASLFMDAPHAGNGSAGLDVDTVLVHLYAQWIAEGQLAGAARTGTGMHLDFPVGVHGAGFDPWFTPDLFAQGTSSGAPPDDFFARGQVWGFPPLDPHRIRGDGYRYYAAALRQSMRLASSLRIDHVMGLHRMYWVPEGLDARDGAYVHYKARELRAVVSLEAHLSGTVVVGEDLGTVPGSVRRSMDRDGFLHSFVFQFRSTPTDPLPVAPASSMATLGTHDLVPFAAYWRGLDMAPPMGGDGTGHNILPERPQPAEGEELMETEQLAEQEGLTQRERWRTRVTEQLRVLEFDFDKTADSLDHSTRAALVGCLEYLSNGPASMVMVELEDLWLETEPQNRPGTGPQAHNFVRRARRTVEQIEEDSSISRVLELVDRARRHRDRQRQEGPQRRAASAGQA